jgi:hypothetical protein
MQALKLLVAAAVAAGALASTANAQSPGKTLTPKKKVPPPPSLAQRNLSPTRSTGRKPPPPPLGRSSARSAPRLSPRSMETMFLSDPMGRIDLAGRPVPFYPSSRSLGKNQSPAGRAPSSSGRR